MDTVPSPTDDELLKKEEIVVKGEPQPSVSGGDVKVTKCHLCDYVAENRTKFTAHMKSEHKKAGGSPGGTPKEKSFACDLCDYRATSKAHVKDHKKTIHDKIKDFACDRCDFRSARKTHLKDHIKTQHDMIKDFACDQCDYREVHLLADLGWVDFDFGCSTFSLLLGLMGCWPRKGSTILG